MTVSVSSRVSNRSRSAPSVAAMALGLAAILAAGPVRADPIADFYHGRDVKLIVSSSPGGGYDTYARLISRHLDGFVPGKPRIVVQNMPGAGGLKAGNYLYQVAPKDGSVIAGVQNNVPFAPLLGRRQARYDPRKFNWLGSPNSEVGLLLVWHTVPVNSFADATKRVLLMGSSGAASTPAFYGRILNAVLGTKLKMVNGYPGQTEAFLAMERGELDGYPSTFWSSLKAIRPEWIKDHKVKLLLQYGRKPDPELPNVPVARDLAKTPADRQLLDVAMAPLVLGRPYLAPPGVPAARVKALRTAFAATFKDAAFLKDAKKVHLEISPTPQTGADMTALIAETYAAPKPVLERLVSIYNQGRVKMPKTN